LRFRQPGGRDQSSVASLVGALATGLGEEPLSRTSPPSSAAAADDDARGPGAESETRVLAYDAGKPVGGVDVRASDPRAVSDAKADAPTAPMAAMLWMVSAGEAGSAKHAQVPSQETATGEESAPTRPAVVATVVMRCKVSRLLKQ
jgi:hypothetical protein